MAHVKESVLLFPLRHYRYIYYRSSFKAFAVVGKKMWRRRWQAQAWQKSMNVLCTKVKNTVDMHGKHVFSFVTPCREKAVEPKYKMTSGCFFDLELSAKCKQVEWEFTAFCMACKHMFAYVCFICLYVCLPCSGGYSYFPGCSGLSHIRLSSHTHTLTHLT